LQQFIGYGQSNFSLAVSRRKSRKSLDHNFMNAGLSSSLLATIAP
jgi:hypothetical protein